MYVMLVTITALSSQMSTMVTNNTDRLSQFSIHATHLPEFFQLVDLLGRNLATPHLVLV